MIILSTLYKEKQHFENFINSKNLNLEKDCFIRIYTAIHSPTEILEVVRIVKSIIPNSILIGGSCSGLVFNGKQFDDKTLIIIEQFENMDIKINAHNFKDKDTYILEKEVNDSIAGLEVPLMHILCSDYYTDISDFVNDFNSLNNTTRLVDGVLGEVLPKNLPPYVFTEEGVIINTV